MVLFHLLQFSKLWLTDSQLHLPDTCVFNLNSLGAPWLYNRCLPFIILCNLQKQQLQPARIWVCHGRGCDYVWLCFSFSWLKYFCLNLKQFVEICSLCLCHIHLIKGSTFSSATFLIGPVWFIAKVGFFQSPAPWQGDPEHCDILKECGFNIYSSWKKT